MFRVKQAADQERVYSLTTAANATTKMESLYGLGEVYTQRSTINDYWYVAQLAWREL